MEEGSDGRGGIAWEGIRDSAAEVSSFSSLGNVYADQGRWEEAVAAFERSLESPGWSLFGAAIVHADLGRAQMEVGRDSEAIRSLEVSLEAYESLEGHPNGSAERNRAAEVSYLLARLFARGGDPPEGLKHLRGALWRKPELRKQAAREPDLEAVRRLPEAADLGF